MEILLDKASAVKKTFIKDLILLFLYATLIFFVPMVVLIAFFSSSSILEIFYIFLKINILKISIFIITPFFIAFAIELYFILSDKIKNY